MSLALAARRCIVIGVGSITFGASIAAAQVPDSTKRQHLDTVKVGGRIDDLRGVATTASEGRVGATDIALRPLTREGELLETVPGMIVTQHSGDGKANQYFVRGFNLDHGTDFQTRLDGMPLNMPTNGHGQGYTDLNFIIPEFVDYIDYQLGVYHPEIGDFGSAGGASFHFLTSIDKPFVTTEYGAYDYRRVTGGASREMGPGTLLVGGEAKNYDGPWVIPQGVRKRSGIVRYTVGKPTRRLSVLAMAYENRWTASDQIPERAVTDGIVPRFGQLDSTDGGAARRFSLSATFTNIGVNSSWHVDAFAVRSDLALFSDFTYFLNDPTQGDQFAQIDQRTVLGARAVNTREAQALGASHTLSVGAETRVDLIDSVGLFTTDRRMRTGTIREDAVRESGSGLYVSVESRWTDRLRSMEAVRGDAYTFHVVSDIAANSGDRASAILSPKFSLAYGLTQRTELYASAGFGFHSNDARGTTLTVNPVTGQAASSVTPLVRSRGAELGARSSFSNFRTTLSAWILALDSELLFTGDAGITEPSSATQRLGVSLTNFYRVTRRIAIDADVSFTRARFVGVGSSAIAVVRCSLTPDVIEEDPICIGGPHLGPPSVTLPAVYIPGAIERVATGGVTLDPQTWDPLESTCRHASLSIL